MADIPWSIVPQICAQLTHNEIRLYLCVVARLNDSENVCQSDMGDLMEMSGLSRSRFFTARKGLAVKGWLFFKGDKTFPLVGFTPPTDTPIHAISASVLGGFIYLITDGHFHKIGVTRKSPENRLGALQTASPARLTLVWSYYFPDVYREESNLHRRYAVKRKTGEWFDLTQEDIAEIIASVEGA